MHEPDRHARVPSLAVIEWPSVGSASRHTESNGCGWYVVRVGSKPQYGMFPVSYAFASEAQARERLELHALYELGRYEFTPPPVYSGNWSAADWVNYINAGGGRWLTD